MKDAIIAEWRSVRLLLALAAVSICIGTPEAGTPPAAPDGCVRKMPTPPCAGGDGECIKAWLRGRMEAALARYKAQPIRQFERWAPMLERPLARRVVPFPAAFFDPPDASCSWARRKGAPVAADDPMLAEVSRALEALPRVVRDLAARRVAAVALAEGLEGSATTLEIFDANGRLRATVIVLDAGVLRRFTLNAWATWKENMPFAGPSGARVEVRMATPAGDTRAALIEYALLHELGHAISWEIPASDPALEGTGGATFFHASWVDPGPDGVFASRFDREFPARAQLSYYVAAATRLDARDMQRAYEWLVHTSFPTLYAAVAPQEDFGDSLANYLHTVVLHRPYEVTVVRDGKPALSVGPCWKEQRCAAKRAALEAILKGL